MISAQKSYGLINTPLLIFILIFLLLLGGVLLGPKKSVAPLTGEPVASPASVFGSCCDTGDGEACQVKKGPGETFTFNINGEDFEYGLLKSGVILSEAVIHLKDSGEKAFDEDPIILNAADGFAGPHQCGNGIEDQIWGPRDNFGSNCTPIPNELLLYVCKEGCNPFDTSKPFITSSFNPPDVTPYCASGYLSCYGDKNTKFDVYFRIADENRIPDVIKNCQSSNPFRDPNLPAGQQPTRKEIVFPSPRPSNEQNLQLRNFEIITVTPQKESATWVSPWCKPVIYLYPEKETEVNVKVEALGGLTMSLPEYPASGWDVIAYPDGQLSYLNSFYDYLYYESQIPDEKLVEPRDGYVVEHSKLEELFADLLPKLGLNEKERSQFSDYWLKVLPESSYYFVGVMSQNELNQIADLIVTPDPKTKLRVTLFFKTLDEPISVNPPKLGSPKRDGFTLVEWGGIFKSDKNHHFSCLM